jgi:hypothetical protein
MVQVVGAVQLVQQADLLVKDILVAEVVVTMVAQELRVPVGVVDLVAVVGQVLQLVLLTVEPVELVVQQIQVVALEMVVEQVALAESVEVQAPAV